MCIKYWNNTTAPLTPPQKIRKPRNKNPTPDLQRKFLKWTEKYKSLRAGLQTRVSNSPEAQLIIFQVRIKAAQVTMLLHC